MKHSQVPFLSISGAGATGVRAAGVIALFAATLQFGAHVVLPGQALADTASVKTPAPLGPFYGPKLSDDQLKQLIDKQKASQKTETASDAEALQLAQVQRRRPGSEDAERRSRKEVPTAQTGGATTVGEAERREITRPKKQVLSSSQGTEFFKVPNRWTMLYKGNWYDPYNQNIWKGDAKVFGSDEHPWFFEVTAFSDTLVENRSNPTPVNITSSRGPGRNDIFGKYNQTIINQVFVFETALTQGNTTFKPQDFEIRIAPLVNLNYANVQESGVLRADASRGRDRGDAAFSLFSAFADIHLGNISDRYDFVSSRIGVQEFNADFRGLILNEAQPGVRLFGNVDNNQYQWNLAWFHRLQLDANALVPRLFEDRKEDVFVANLYRQDLIALGHTVEAVGIFRNDYFGNGDVNFDENNNLTSPGAFGNERPHDVQNAYLGLNSDGHFGEVNLNTAYYWAVGRESTNPIADRQTDINAHLVALEASLDKDWIRPKASFVWASGDDDPFDGKAKGFSAIFDNPNYVGGANSYWVRQGIPLIAGGGIALTDRLSFLSDLRPGKTQGQSNFVNPGVLIYNLGVDVDMTPKLVWENNINWLRWDDTATIEVLRQDGSISKDIGIDLSTSFKYRPLLSNNIQFELGYAHLLPGDGFKNLYGDDEQYYQVFGNALFLY